MTRWFQAIHAEIINKGTEAERQRALKAIKMQIAKRAADRLIKELLDEKNADLWFVEAGTDAETCTVKLEYTVEV